ncbi:hypothetical protein MNBD_ALPHA11-1702 [hydrothermal vent metagenome]|uniref:Uncharacterized protein n=1 Tax=hydrothermal vent metagenome TaxID=652676 RepID=A0A3B0U1V4_9ZZZZ
MRVSFKKTSYRRWGVSPRPENFASPKIWTNNRIDSDFFRLSNLNNFYRVKPA